MRKSVIALSLLTTLGGFGLLTSPAMAFGQPDGPPPASPAMAEKSDDLGPFRGKLAEVLDLTPQQQEQIRTILKAEKESTAPLRQSLMENRKKLQEVIEAEPFDEKAVRTLAASQSETRIEMIVNRARVQNQIQAVLTPEQRELAKKLRPLMQERFQNDRPHHPGPGPGFGDNDL